MIANGMRFDGKRTKELHRDVSTKPLFRSPLQLKGRCLDASQFLFCCFEANILKFSCLSEQLRMRRNSGLLL